MRGGGCAGPGRGSSELIPWLRIQETSCMCMPGSLKDWKGPLGWGSWSVAERHMDRSMIVGAGKAGDMHAKGRWCKREVLAWLSRMQEQSGSEGVGVALRGQIPLQPSRSFFLWLSFSFVFIFFPPCNLPEKTSLLKAVPRPPPSDPPFCTHSFHLALSLCTLELWVCSCVVHSCFGW